jgi:protein involved in polysaccharide export with SLBB domain
MKSHYRSGVVFLTAALMLAAMYPPGIARAQGPNLALEAERSAAEQMPTPADAAMDEEPPQANDEESNDASDLSTLAIGDTLNIKFYKHADLTGEYLIRADGTVSVPLLGSVRLAGKSLSQAEDQLARRMSSLAGRRAYVSVAVSKYRPIYVVGHVDKAGSYPWMPDLDVLQAVSLAGGYPRLSDGVTVDRDREAGRLKENAELLARALVRRERLLAERDGKTSFRNPDGLTDLVDEMKVRDIAQTEQRQLDRELGARNDKKENLKRQVTLVEEEVDALTSRRTAVKTQIELNTKQSRRINSLLEKGIATQQRATDLESEVKRLESEEGELLADIAQARQRLATAMFERDHADMEPVQLLERQLAEVERDIDTYRTAVDTSRSILRRYGTSACPTGARGHEPTILYQLVRKSGHRTETIDADETSRVLPGDTLRVRQLDVGCAPGPNRPTG